MNISLGQIAFEAYSKAMGGQTYDGKPIPTWENLTKGQQARDAWEAAAKAVEKNSLLISIQPKRRGK